MSIFNLVEAIKNLKPEVQFSFKGKDGDEENVFNNIKWNTGVKENGYAITTTVNPHSELTWEKVNTEMNRLQTEYDSKYYARKREEEYPPTADFMEAYTEKEIGSNSTKWDAYVINYNKVRTENPK
jgi:hypothetical protein